MQWIGAVGGAALIAVVFLDAFAAMILPRRVKHVFLARLFYRSSWAFWRAVARLVPSGRWRHAFLSVFGPLSLLALLAVWASSLSVAFALLYWSLDSRIEGADDGFLVRLYFSATTFFTLGFGDLIPKNTTGRTLAALEAGLGYGFLAVIISYLPVLYQAFSRREIVISLLDARAGSPPCAGEFLRRLASGRGAANLGPFLADQERWSAELLESHLSYPVLSFYRSQHDNQSWVAALTCILDTSALLITAADGPESYQARLTFAMARHAAVDLALVSRTLPRAPKTPRLEEGGLAQLRSELRQAGLQLRDEPQAAAALDELRGLYEPVVSGLAEYYQVELPSFQPAKPPVDNWQTSPWMRRSPGLGGLAPSGGEVGHFD